METPTTTIVRRATRADAAALARLRLDFRGPRAPNLEAEQVFLERCAAWMAPRLTSGAAWRAWVLDWNDRVAGNVWVQVIEKLPNPTAEAEIHAYVSNLYVAPAHRNEGAGTALLRAALDECARLEVDSIFLWPSARSRSLYRRHGFVVRDDILVLKR